MSEAISDEERPSSTDLRMAEILAATDRPLAGVRKELQDEGSGEADDLLARINALNYLDGVVGEVGGDLPERLGDYRITGLLGRGGMGTVFEAFQESLERNVALKVLAPGLTTDLQMRKRFRTEARACATLHHQHIVPVYGFGEAAGFLYFTMERVMGVSLDRHIAAARHQGEPAMEPREAARRFAGVADALDHAHRRGILHRDVKPGNILVHPDGSLALADFGLSKVVGEASVTVSGHGGFLGTLHYASPEQAKGRGIAGASDLYSLGVTLYETVTGQLPVSGKTTEAMLQAVLYESPRPLRQLAPRAPKDLEAVLRKLLQKDPADRYSDGEALARDLLRVADDEPVRIRMQSPFVLLWRQVRKRPGLTAALLLASVLLIVSFVLWRAKEAEHDRSSATRHQNLLASAMAQAEAESGDAWGPGGVLAVLTGIEPDSPTPRAHGASEVMALLDQALSVLPDDRRPRELSDAYLDDPVPEATRLLRDGHGFAALGVLNLHIRQAEQRSGFASRDAVTWLLLYRLYVGRAVARLSSTVADAEAAGKDLLRASLVRPGAFFPAMLIALLEWSPAEGVDALVVVVDELLADAPPAAGLAVGAMLQAFAGLTRPAGADLMEFAMPFPVRRALHDKAIALLLAGQHAPAAGIAEVAVACGPIERELRTAARAGRDAIGDRPRQKAAFDRGRELLDSAVAPGSPLQCWRLCYDLLEDPTAGAPALPDGSPLSRDVQLRGWIGLLQLEPPPDVLRALASPLESTIGADIDAGAEVEVRRLQALVARIIGTPDEALRAATAWVETEPENPAAYLCRFHARLRIGDPAWASYDGTAALQRAVDRRAMADEIVAMLQRAEVDATGSPLVRDWARLRLAFGGRNG